MANRYDRRNYLLNKLWKRKQKLALIEYKGGKCERCGYSDLNYPSVFDFHHIDPTQKEYSIGHKKLSFNKMKSEVDKCLLVCRNCHAEIHEELNGNLIIEAVEAKKREYKPVERVCCCCGNKFPAKTKRNIYCHDRCRVKAHRNKTPV